MRQSLISAVTYYLTHDYNHYRFITPPLPLPFKATVSGVANHSAPSNPARKSATNGDTYYLTLHYNQVRLIMPPPPFEGGGGNHYTSSLHSWAITGNPSRR